MADTTTDLYAGLTEEQRGKCGRLCAECEQNETCTDKEKAEACKEMVAQEAMAPDAPELDEANPWHGPDGRFSGPETAVGSWSLQFSGGGWPNRVRRGKKDRTSKRPCGQKARGRGGPVPAGKWGQRCQDSVEPPQNQEQLAEANPWHDESGRFSGPADVGSWSLQFKNKGTYAQRVRRGKKDRTSKRPCGRAARPGWPRYTAPGLTPDKVGQRCSEQIDLAGLLALAEAVRS